MNGEGIANVPRTRTKTVTVFKPHSRMDSGLFESARLLLVEISSCMPQIATTFRADFRRSYTGTRLDLAWKIFAPLIPVIVYTVLARSRVLPGFENVSSSAAIAAGVTLWFLFAGCVSQPVRTVETRTGMVTKTALPLSAVVLAGFAELSFETLVRVIFTIGVFVVTGTIPAMMSPAALVVLLAGTAFFFGIGLCLSMVNFVFPDTGRITSLILQYGIFVSGVFFPLSMLPGSELLAYNPFTVFIDGVRQLLFVGEPAHPIRLLVYSCLGILTLLFGTRLFYIMELRVRGIA